MMTNYTSGPRNIVRPQGLHIATKYFIFKLVTVVRLVKLVCKVRSHYPVSDSDLTDV